MESQSSKELEMPKEDAAWEQRVYNADLAKFKQSGAPGATVPLTGAGPRDGEIGKKLAETVRSAVERGNGEVA
jgi:hypothetical protein